jgi:hypothetical protein
MGEGFAKIDTLANSRATGLIPTTFVASVQCSGRVRQELSCYNPALRRCPLRMFDRLGRASEYGRVVSQGNGSR